jgi:Spy/CpxP family protein refolding chaperone
MREWKFGIQQSNRQERREIRRALAAGRIDEYMERQLWARMIEAETERRRARRRRR